LRGSECGFSPGFGYLTGLPEPLRQKSGCRIRPLGVDRLGIRLRVEAEDGDHDVRLAFESAAETAEQLRAQVGLLVGCPFRAAH